VSALPPVAEALLKPETYSQRPRRIELVQTQMSFIFLTGEYVYKIKKPVNLGYLDYTTLEKRHFFCLRELKLNRRLCPDAYLAVVPVVGEAGRFCIGGQGKATEYAVKMRQLPRERMMDVLLVQGEVTREMVARVARKLVDFHQKTETSREIGAFGKLDVIRRNCDENFSQTMKYIGATISAEEHQYVRRYTDDFIDSNATLFGRRVAEGRIRDCHGDLHAAHICFADDICVYDCIEFNDRFRYSDVASEMAFLAMDLDRYQHAALSRHLVNTYVELSQDSELMNLLRFYECYRAYVRGKVESFKLDDPYIPPEEKSRAVAVARDYFRLARSYI
jgi:aminoglycoside phosphotransferase family enzyme